VDVVVTPSVRTSESEDQSPRSVIEAMMSGCVVVGSDCGAIPLMIGDAGLITRQGDIEDLADGIVAAVSRSSDAALRSLARTRAIARYSPDTAASETIGFWERAIAAPRRAERR
jgi:glycosyltransferase involved in cell wall biosynthesis